MKTGDIFIKASTSSVLFVFYDDDKIINIVLWDNMSEAYLGGLKGEALMSYLKQEEFTCIGNMRSILDTVLKNK